MSLLNSPSDGLHSILIAIHETLRLHENLTRDELIDLVAPLPLFNGRKGTPQEKAKATLNRWIQLGLFVETNNKQIAIHNNDFPLPVLARIRLLDEANNIDFLKTKSAPAGDFTRAVTWFLSQNSWTLDSSSWIKIQPLMKLQLPNLRLNPTVSGIDKAVLDQEEDEEADGHEDEESSQSDEITSKRVGNLIQNGSRWKIFCDWARFLGFGWRARNGLLVSDPTEAVRDVLPQIFGKSKELEARTMVNSLAQVIPVLDGGTYRERLETELKKTQGPDAWCPPPNSQLSTSLSRALLRLQEEKAIKAEMKADAKSSVRISLSGRNNQVIAEYSHFIRIR